MTPEEQAKKIEEIYNEAIKKMEALGSERQKLLRDRKDIIKNHVKKLEAQKLSAVRQSLGLTE